MFQRTVMPYSATPPKPAITRSSRFSNSVADVAHRRRRGSKAERLDLQPVDRHHRVAVVHQVMRQREAGGAEPDDQHLAAGVGPRQRAADVQRIPARQQANRSRSPRAGPARPSGSRSRPAECRPAPASGRCRTSCSRCRCGGRWRPHRVVDRDGREGAEHAALGAQRVHLADFFFQRAARQGHAERAISGIRRSCGPSGPCEQESLPWLWHQMQ